MPAEGGGPRRARRRALAALAGAASGLVPGPDAARAADRPPPGVPGTPAPSAPPARGDTHPFAFGLIGDLPYTETGEPDADRNTSDQMSSASFSETPGFSIEGRVIFV